VTNDGFAGLRGVSLSRVLCHERLPANENIFLILQPCAGVAN
jgi:hypothetical protein